MWGHARSRDPDPVLVDGAANYFGTEGAGFSLRSARRSHGTLALTGEALVFDQPPPGSHIEIPIEQIERLGVGYWHLYRSSPVPVLKVTYNRNLVFGVIVPRPERWINAVQALTRKQGRAIQIEPYTPLRIDPRRFRILISAALILVLLLGVVLPVFFSWMHARTLSPSSAPSSAP